MPEAVACKDLASSAVGADLDQTATAMCLHSTVVRAARRSDSMPQVGVWEGHKVLLYKAAQARQRLLVRKTHTGRSRSQPSRPALLTLPTSSLSRMDTLSRPLPGLRARRLQHQHSSPQLLRSDSSPTAWGWLAASSRTAPAVRHSSGSGPQALPGQPDSQRKLQSRCVCVCVCAGHHGCGGLPAITA